MTEDQRTAFGRWATSVGVTIASPGHDTQLQEDFAYLQGGILQAGVPLLDEHGR
jgi:hypothetical protein